MFGIRKLLDWNGSSSENELGELELSFQKQIANKSTRFTCLDYCMDGVMIVGTSTGSLLRMLQSVEQSKISFHLIDSFQLAKKAITSVLIIRELELLVVQQDSNLLFLDLFTFQQRFPLLKNCTCPPRFTAERLHVGRQNCISVFTLKKTKITLYKEFQTRNPVLLLDSSSKFLVYATSSGYFILDNPSLFICPFGQIPIIEFTSKDEVLIVTQSNVGVFVSKSGDATRATIEWPLNPLQVKRIGPFIFAFFKNKIIVNFLDTQSHTCTTECDEFQPILQTDLILDSGWVCLLDDGSISCLFLDKGDDLISYFLSNYDHSSLEKCKAVLEAFKCSDPIVSQVYESEGIRLLKLEKYHQAFEWFKKANTSLLKLTNVSSEGIINNNYCEYLLEYFHLNNHNEEESLAMFKALLDCNSEQVAKFLIENKLNVKDAFELTENGEFRFLILVTQNQYKESLQYLNFNHIEKVVQVLENTREYKEIAEKAIECELDPQLLVQVFASIDPELILPYFRGTRLHVPYLEMHGSKPEYLDEWIQCNLKKLSFKYLVEIDREYSKISSNTSFSFFLKHKTDEISQFRCKLADFIRESRIESIADLSEFLVFENILLLLNAENYKKAIELLIFKLKDLVTLKEFIDSGLIYNIPVNLENHQQFILNLLFDNSEIHDIDYFADFIISNFSQCFVNDPQLINRIPNYWNLKLVSPILEQTFKNLNANNNYQDKTI